MQLALFVCAWEQRERLDLSLVPALQDQMHACAHVTTELLPSSRCRQHHLLPRLTTDFLALLRRKRGNDWPAVFPWATSGTTPGTSSSTSIAVRSSVARRAQLGTTPLQWFHLRLDEIRMRRERIESSQSVLVIGICRRA